MKRKFECIDKEMICHQPLPPELIYSISRYLDHASTLRLAKVCKSYYSFFKYDNDKVGLKALYDETNEFIKNLFCDVISGNVLEAKEALRLFPRLLMYPATIHQYGRYHFDNRTLYQIALANEDEYMLKMMDIFFSIIENGGEEKKRQFKEQFPDGKLIKYDWDREKANVLFDDLFTAISQDGYISSWNLNKMSHVTQNALKAFYDYITPTESAKFTKGLVFDMDFFMYTKNKYATHHIHWTNSKCIFYMVKVHGYLQRLLPTGYLKAYDYGLSLLIDNEVLTLRKLNITRLLPLDKETDSDSNNSSILGQNYYIDATGEKSSYQPALWYLETEKKVLEKMIFVNQASLNRCVERYIEKKSCCVLF